MGYITLTHVVLQEEGDNAYTGYCPELGTATCGDTPDEAMQNLGEAVVMHLNALEETGERKRFFKELGHRQRGPVQGSTHPSPPSTGLAP